MIILLIKKHNLNLLNSNLEFIIFYQKLKSYKNKKQLNNLFSTSAPYHMIR